MRVIIFEILSGNPMDDIYGIVIEIGTLQTCVYDTTRRTEAEKK